MGTGSVDERPLRPGDIVEVRAPAEILAALDGDASANGMPFMPEMLPYVGRRFTVSRRAEKICDTVSGGPARSLRLRDTVLLDDLRCDGSAHGGCQAGCRLYWKESWLRRVEPGDVAQTGAEYDGNGENSRQDDLEGRAQLEELAQGCTRTVREIDGVAKQAYRCQATEALQATEPLGNFDLRQYFREFASGNVRLLRLLRVALRGLTVSIGRRLRLLSWRPLHAGETIPTRGDLGLQPGELVEVRSAEEIARTIDAREDPRARVRLGDAPLLGRPYRVRDRVERIVDEKTGQMIEISSDCVILEGVVCSGEHSEGRWFCPRGSFRTGGRPGFAGSRMPGSSPPRTDRVPRSADPLAAEPRPACEHCCEIEPRGCRGHGRHSDLEPVANAPTSIASVLGQTYRDFTLLVSDNASDDDTAGVVGSIRDPRIVYRPLEQNIGRPANYNRLIELAETEFIVLLSDDDQLHPDHLSLTLDALRHRPTVGMAHTGT